MSGNITVNESHADAGQSSRRTAGRDVDDGTTTLLDAPGEVLHVHAGELLRARLRPATPSNGKMVTTQE